MSDVFVSAGLPIDPADAASRLRWRPSTQTWSGNDEGLVWAVGRVDDPLLWGPAWDPASRVRVLLNGRAAFDPSEWDWAERLPYEGGLAGRLILSRWLERGAAGVEELNGAALAVVIDEKAHEAHVWTDRMGFMPAFIWTGGGFVLCSHPDVAADALASCGRPCDLDPVTMAEFLQTGTATHPHTYWRGIEHLDAGTRHRFTFGSDARICERHTYWRPAYFDTSPITDRREIVARLTDALLAAVRRRTQPRLGRVAVMLSSGADSRTALFGACEPARVTCYTLYDEPNEELNGAQRLAAAAGARHVAIKRSSDYYIEHAAEAVRLSGGMWTIQSAHYGGVASSVLADAPGVVLTGCYADYLLKGIAFNRQPRTIFGRPIPIYDFSEFSYGWHHDHCPLPGEFGGRVMDRLARRFGSLSEKYADNYSEVEFLRLSPIVREPDASGRLFLRRAFPVDFFVSDNAVLSLFGSMCASEKLNGIPFGMAVDKIVGAKGRAIPNNNFGAPVGADEFRRVAAFVCSSLKRKLSGSGTGQPFDRDPASIATAASWPHFPRIIEHSSRLREWRAGLPADQAELLFDMVGQERRAWTNEEWARRDPTLFLRIYTASLWLSQRSGVLGQLGLPKDLSNSSPAASALLWRADRSRAADRHAGMHTS